MRPEITWNNPNSCHGDFESQQHVGGITFMLSGLTTLSELIGLTCSSSRTKRITLEPFCLNWVNQDWEKWIVTKLSTFEEDILEWQGKKLCFVIFVHYLSLSISVGVFRFDKVELSFIFLESRMKFLSNCTQAVILPSFIKEYLIANHVTISVTFWILFCKVLLT